MKGDTASERSLLEATDLTRAYREGKLSPREVVKRALEEARKLAARTPSIGPLCEYADDAAMTEATLAEKRWREGKPGLL